ncbi:MAG: WbqC family protein [Chloroflexi bacterium]|nr:WbqC family protein [Chloroflexota bacterium]
MRVTIHQPEFIPWLGFFHKASLADMLVVLDDAQFRKNYFQNRNRIRTAEGSVWVTVPVTRNLGTPINEVRIAAEGNPRWADRIENAVALAYRRAPHFESVQGGFVGCLRGAGETLVSLNIPLLRWMLEQFGLSKKVVLSSSLGTEARGSQRILDIGGFTEHAHEPQTQKQCAGGGENLKLGKSKIHFLEHSQFACPIVATAAKRLC